MPGKRTSYVRTVVVPIGVSTQVLNQRGDRTRITISADATNPLWIQFGSPINAAQGILLPASNRPWVISISKDAQIAQGPIFIFFAAGGGTVTIWETIAPEG